MTNINDITQKMNITVSIHEKNHIYQAIINYKDENNKRKQKWISTRIKVARGNKKKALQKAEQLRKNFEDSINPQETEDNNEILLFKSRLYNIDTNKTYDENILFIEYIKLWIEKIKNSIEITTYTSHMQMINSRIQKYFTLNPIKLLELKPIHIQNFYDSLLSDGLKSSTVIRYHAIIRKSLDYAFKYDLIINNPADKVTLPKKNIFTASDPE